MLLKNDNNNNNSRMHSRINLQQTINETKTLTTQNCKQKKNAKLQRMPKSKFNENT